MTMTDIVHAHVIPAAFAVLPERMRGRQATAMLLAIGLQESRFERRRQSGGGPARGFWQFEIGGLLGVMDHQATRQVFRSVVGQLRYSPDAAASVLHPAIEHNDVLACACARLLLWTLPTGLPGPGGADVGWRQYFKAWRPGKPHPTTWDANFASAWALVEGT